MSSAFGTFADLVAPEFLKLRTTRTMLVLTIVALVVTVAFVLLILIVAPVDELTGTTEGAGPQVVDQEMRDTALVLITYPGAIVGLILILGYLSPLPFEGRG